jgi:hypothetical protein
MVLLGSLEAAHWEPDSLRGFQTMSFSKKNRKNLGFFNSVFLEVVLGKTE